MISMGCNIVNKTPDTLTGLTQMAEDFFPYAKEQMGFDQSVCVVLQSDSENAGNILGKTAHYDPNEMAITLFTDGRHPKDILRSLSHELVHHSQNCRGEFDSVGELGPGYAQKDDHMREMEREAYEKGNLVFRDWEDLFKQRTLQENMNKKVKVTKEELSEIIKEELNQVPLNEIGIPFWDIPESWDIPYIEPTKWADKAVGVVGDVLSNKGVQIGLEVVGCAAAANPYLCTLAVSEIASVATDEEKFSPTYWAMKAAEKGAEVFMPSEVALDQHEKPGYDPSKTRRGAASREMEKIVGKTDMRGDKPIYDKDRLSQALASKAKPKSAMALKKQLSPAESWEQAKARDQIRIAKETDRPGFTDYEVSGPGSRAARRDAALGWESDERQQSVFKPGVLPDEERWREDDIRDVQNILKSQDAQNRPMSEGIKSEMDMQQIIKEEFEKLMLDEGAWDRLLKLFKKKPKLDPSDAAKAQKAKEAGDKVATAAQKGSAGGADLRKAQDEFEELEFGTKPKAEPTAPKAEPPAELREPPPSKKPDPAKTDAPDVPSSAPEQKMDPEEWGEKYATRAEEDYLNNDFYDKLNQRAQAPIPGMRPYAQKAQVPPVEHTENFGKLQDLRDAAERHKTLTPDDPRYVSKADYHKKLQDFHTTQKAIRRADVARTAKIVGGIGAAGAVTVGGYLYAKDSPEHKEAIRCSDDTSSAECKAFHDEQAEKKEEADEKARRAKAYKNENMLKETIKKMVIEALKNQKVNEQPLTPPGPPPKPETMDIKVDRDPDVGMPPAPPEEQLTPSEKDELDVLPEDLEFESAQDLKEKIAEEKFNKLVNAIAKK